MPFPPKWSRMPTRKENKRMIKIYNKYIFRRDSENGNRIPWQ
jgi:hypothetical protein